ncbi:response regulator [Rhodanobacter sp. 7MK24]|uniref:response regulator n=1 Tax=Rhodanobacter sp. 7MK24 TaxID=2775922 RepID=UPI00177C35A2|nr:response regulator [Rhodanobacter sp. 7MK24]MBD8882327.1 response regulator [Rhodanobacter sp. 7MK24]
MSSATPCILVAEDEMLVAMTLEDVIQRAGFSVLLTARLSQGMELAATEWVDAAILDINLAGEDSFPLAAELRRRKIPFVFASGYGSDGLPDEYRDVEVLLKPYSVKHIEDALDRMIAAGRAA